MKMERLVNVIEEGRMFWLIQAAVIFAPFFFIITGHFLAENKTVTRVYDRTEAKKYHIKKVSFIPREKLKDEADKIAVEDDALTEEELKERYFSYVISKIESNKVYPVIEQRKGHQGTVRFTIYINRSGGIEKVKVLKQASYLNLTRAAIAAIKKSLPFKAYSGHIKDDVLIIDLEIDFSLEQ